MRFLTHDAAIYHEVATLEKGSKMQDNVQHTDARCGDWQLSLETNKCKVLLLRRNKDPLSYNLWCLYRAF